MSFTVNDAVKLVGDSTDWKKGLEVSRLKWEQIVAGDDSYWSHSFCGFCIVKDNRSELCWRCPARPICKMLRTGASSQEILDALLALELPQEELVSTEAACPDCGERRADELLWTEEEAVVCQTCKCEYVP